MLLNSKENILKKLEHYCAYQDRCQWEVSKKLNALGVEKILGEEITLSLIQSGYLNEERFVNSAIRGKFNINHWGRVKIKQWLKAREIQPNLISNGLKIINEEEYEDKMKLIIQKELNKHQNLPSSKSKIINLLLSKGFENELIYSALDSIIWKNE